MIIPPLLTLWETMLAPLKDRQAFIIQRLIVPYHGEGTSGSVRAWYHEYPYSVLLLSPQLAHAQGTHPSLTPSARQKNETSKHLFPLWIENAERWGPSSPQVDGGVSCYGLREAFGPWLAGKAKMTRSGGTRSLWVTDGLALWCLAVWIGAPLWRNPPEIT